MNVKLFIYEPKLEQWLLLFGGVFVIFLIAYLVTKFTKFGGGSNYGIDDEFEEYDGFVDFD